MNSLNINNAYSFVSLLFAMFIISLLVFNNSSGLSKDLRSFTNFNFLQYSYALEDENEEDEENEKVTRGNSIMKIAAVGDWDCNGEAKDTVKNIINQDPDIVLALGDLSYNGKANMGFPWYPVHISDHFPYS